MRKIAILNTKGGTGKTTLCRNLSSCLVLENKKRVIMCDGDPQGSLTIASGYNPDKLNNNLSSLLVKILNKEKIDIRDYILKTKDSVFLIPGDIYLSKIELALHQVMSREHIFKKGLKQLDNLNFDICLVDSPPFLSLLTINIMSYVDSVIIPITPDHLSYRSHTILFESIKEVKENINPDLKILGVLFNKADKRLSHTLDVIDFAKKTLEKNTYIFNSIIRDNTYIKEASIKGQSILEYKNNAIGSNDIRAFTKEFLGRLNLWQKKAK